MEQLCMVDIHLKKTEQELKTMYSGFLARFGDGGCRRGGSVRRHKELPLYQTQPVPATSKTD